MTSSAVPGPDPDPAAPSDAAAPGPPVLRAPGTGAPEMVTLRVVREEDAAVLAELERRNRGELLVGAPQRPDSWFTEEAQRDAIRRGLVEAEAGRSLPLVIVLGASSAEGGDEGRVVGRLSISSVIRGALQSASIGYWVDVRETGRGVATRAVHSAVEIAFSLLGLHRLQAEVQVGNDASVRILEACGFVEYGQAPQYLHLGGRWADCRLFQRVDPGWSPQGREVEEPGGALRWAEDSGDEASGDRAGACGEKVPRAPHLAEPVEISAGRPSLGEAVTLYDAVGWSVYTQERSVLDRALDGSAHVVTARRSGRLVGLARVITDGAMTVYLQDVLVDPEEQRDGIGRRLVEAVLAPYRDVRTTVLLTDTDPAQRAFYEAIGLTEVHEHPVGLRSFLRIR